MTEGDTERELQILRGRYRAIVESSPVGIVVHAEGIVRFVNEAAARIMRADSTDELLGRLIMDFVHPESLVEVRRRVADMYRVGGDHDLQEQRWTRLDGSTLWVEVVASSTSWDGVAASQAVFSDITRRKEALEQKAELEAQLHHAMRLESVGRLAGGIAHDFNNLLTAIKGYVQLVSRSLPRGHSVQADLSEVDRVADRAAELTRQLLAFSRRQTISPRVLLVHEAVEEMRRLLDRVVGEDVTFVMTNDPDPWRVSVDPGQLEQVLMNLVVNARDAMPGGGRLSIHIGNASRGEGTGSLQRSTSTEYICITVVDDGAGMDPITLDKIFEPFFSTKETGTGLGLSTVYGIVEQNHGFIDVRSAVGEGTRFEVYLPRTTDDLVREELPTREETTALAGTVLIAEDEPAVRSLTELILTEQGYSVHSAEDGAAALSFASQFTGTIDLLLTDVVMPGMNGRQLYERLHEQRPALSVLYMSGYPNDIVANHGVLEDNTQFLHKPFDVDALCDAVRQAMARHLARRSR